MLNSMLSLKYCDQVSVTHSLCWEDKMILRIILTTEKTGSSCRSKITRDLSRRFLTPTEAEKALIPLAKQAPPPVVSRAIL